MIKIFSHDKIVYLIDDQTHFKNAKRAVLVSVDSAEEVKTLYEELANKNLKEIYFYHPDILTIYQYFSSQFKIVRAAGGLVTNSNGELLFIFRNGKWDLPKGKIEKEEEIAAAALREVEEECGVKGLAITRELCTTYHIYQQEGKKILKPTYWYEMKCSDNSPLVPQQEEGISEARWVSATALKEIKKNTFGSILQVLEKNC